MRIFYAFVFILLSGTWLNAQIEITTPTYSPILKNHAEQEEKARAAIIDNFKKRHPERLDSRDQVLANTLIVVTGESQTDCRDTLFLTGPGSSFNLLNCSPLNNGTVTLDSTCITYTANPGITLARDTVCVEFCKNATDCDTLFYPIIIKRPNGIVNLGNISLNAQETFTYCASMDTVNLPGDFTMANIVSENTCGEYIDFGTQVTKSDLCLMYEAGNFSESDEVCFLICDNASVCDTIKLQFDIAQDTLTLPFFDDFNYTGPYPDPSRWLNEEVYVNATFGDLPPSVGVATFDGLTQSGSPRGGGVGDSDVLTSTYLNLGTGLDTAFLSFFIQPKGNGDAPEVSDSLILEFKTIDDRWVEINSYAGLSSAIASDSIPPFLYQEVIISDPDYLYNGFQFAFTNKSSNLGAGDLWHLDYVQVGAGLPNDSPNDIAFVKMPTPLLKDYTSMPWKHFMNFASQELDTEITAVAKNISSNDLSISNSNTQYNELVTGANNLDDFTIFDPINGDTQFDAKETKTVNRSIPNFSNYASNIESQMAGADSLIFETQYTIVPSVNQDFFRTNNDTVSRQTVFYNYFAYDDGTAESNLAAKGSGTQVAVKFHANVADSLRAIQMYIPHFNVDVSSQFFNLKVWLDDLESEPIYLAELLQPVYVDTHFDSIQGFTTYRLQNYFTGEITPVAIPANSDFYIGWEQVSNEFDNAIPIGYDRNNPDAAQFISVNTGTGWSAFPQFVVQGALMLRPVLGSKIPPLTSSDDLQSIDNQISIYPNPSKGRFYIDVENESHANYNIEVINAVGALVHRQILTKELFLDNLKSGIYFVKITNFTTQKSINKKIILVH